MYNENILFWKEGIDLMKSFKSGPKDEIQEINATINYIFLFSSPVYHNA